MACFGLAGLGFALDWLGKVWFNMGKGYRIRLAHTLADGTRVSVPCKMNTIKSENLKPKPKITKKDSNGVPIAGNKKTLVMKDSYNKFRQTGNPSDLEKTTGRTTYVYINANGEVVNSKDITNWYHDPDTGKDIEVDPLDPTIGKGHEVEIVKTPLKSDKDSFLIEKTFSITCEPEDAPTLYRIADELAKNGQMGVIDIVISESFDQYIGMIVPTVDPTSDRFYITVYASRTRMVPEWMDATGPSPEPAKKKKTVPVTSAGELFTAPEEDIEPGTALIIPKSFFASPSHVDEHIAEIVMLYGKDADELYKEIEGLEDDEATEKLSEIEAHLSETAEMGAPPGFVEEKDRPEEDIDWNEGASPTATEMTDVDKPLNEWDGATYNIWSAVRGRRKLTDEQREHIAIEYGRLLESGLPKWAAIKQAYAEVLK